MINCSGLQKLASSCNNSLYMVIMIAELTLILCMASRSSKALIQHCPGARVKEKATTTTTNPTRTMREVRGPLYLTVHKMFSVIISQEIPDRSQGQSCESAMVSYSPVSWEWSVIHRKTRCSGNLQDIFWVWVGWGRYRDGWLFRLPFPSHTFPCTYEKCFP